MEPIKHIPGLEAIHDGYEVFLVDAWGVLHDGTDCYPGVKHCLEQLTGQGKQVIVLSNAARRHDAIKCELSRVGISPGMYHSVLSSGELAWHWLSSASNISEIGNSGYYLGPERSQSLCDGLPVRWVDRPEDASFVLNTGAPVGNPADASALTPILERMLKHGLPMLCANPDQVAVRAGEMGISAGAIARLYQSLGARRIVYYGKPYADLFELALQVLPGIDKSRVLMVGDAFETDIAGAANFGIDSLFIAGGIHQAELAPLSRQTVIRVANQYATSPTYFCQSFCW
jgi:HAD superfamily hydrolase (TIGR01459 family)